MNECDEENIRVCIRFRPVNEREERISRNQGGLKTTYNNNNTENDDEYNDDNSDLIPWRWDNRSVVPLFPTTRGERSRQRAVERYQRRSSDNSTLGRDDNEFHFDRVYDIDESTEVLYNEIMQDLVVSAMEGKHCSAFAFGQTSTGKTYTMQGTSERPGVIPRSVHDIFSYINQSNDREFLLRVSYLEVYNESINDLFTPTSTNLKVFEDPKRGPKVQGLEEKIVVTPEQVFALISAGEAQRHIGCTDYNKQSSRSHTIFRIVIESKLRDFDNDEKSSSSSSSTTTTTSKRRTARVATLNLVDLAGSEAAQTLQTKTRKQEGSFINKSLLTLTHVIYKLSEVAQKSSKTVITHIPYRDSKLTRILQQSLQGNSKISIVCTTTPWIGAKEETLNTLRFATRAKKVKHQVQVNEVLDDRALLLKYKQEIAELRRKLADAERKTQLSSPLQNPQPPPLPTTTSTSENDDTDTKTNNTKENDKLREQIDTAIRNLNRVILNSGLPLAETSNTTANIMDNKNDLIDEKDDDKDQAIENKTHVRRNSSLDESTPFFRRLRSFDEQLHQNPVDAHHHLDSKTRVHRSRSQSSVHSMRYEDSPKKLLDFENMEGSSPSSSRSILGDTDKGEITPRRKSTSAVETSMIIPPKFLESQKDNHTKTLAITNELRSIREQLASLLENDKSQDDMKSDGDKMKDDVDSLKTRIVELENLIQRHNLERSVNKADRSFLEKLLEEKEQTIKDWSVMIKEIEAKQVVLENSNEKLKDDYQELENSNEILKEENEEILKASEILQKENEQFLNANQALQDENEELLKANDILQAENQHVLSENEVLKQENEKLHKLVDKLASSNSSS